MDKELAGTAKGAHRVSPRELGTPRRRNQVHKRTKVALRAARSHTVPQFGRDATETSLGTFSETTSPEHQLHWIIENCKLVRDANGINVIVEALKIASAKHDLLRSVSSGRQLSLIDLLQFSVRCGYLPVQHHARGEAGLRRRSQHRTVCLFWHALLSRRDVQGRRSVRRRAQ